MDQIKRISERAQTLSNSGLTVDRIELKSARAFDIIVMHVSLPTPPTVTIGIDVANGNQ